MEQRSRFGGHDRAKTPDYQDMRLRALNRMSPLGYDESLIRESN